MNNRSVLSIRHAAVAAVVALAMFFGLQAFAFNPAPAPVLAPLVASGQVLNPSGNPFGAAVGQTVYVTGPNNINVTVSSLPNVNWGFSGENEDWPSGYYLATITFTHKGKTYQGQVSFYHTEGVANNPVNITCLEI